MTMNELTTLPNYIKSDRISKITIKNIPVAVLLELIFVYIPPEEIVQLLTICHDWNRLLSQSCLTLEYFWRDMCLNTNNIPMLILNNIKRKNKERNRKRKERLKKQIKQGLPSVDDSKSESLKVMTKEKEEKKGKKLITQNFITEAIKSVHRTENIIKEMCDRVFLSLSRSGTTKTSKRNPITPSKPSWHHRLSAQRILFQRWRNIPNDKTKRGNKETQNQNIKIIDQSYSTYHYTTPDKVGSWVLMFEDRYLAYSTNGFINVIDVNTMKPPSYSDIPLSTIKLPVQTPSEYGWLMPLSSTSPWAVTSFGSCIQMSNIITGQSFHNIIQKDSFINCKQDSGCIADGHTSQPVAFTYAKPILERWDLNTMTRTTPLAETIDFGYNDWMRMAINDSHSIIATSQIYYRSNIIDYRSNTLVDYSSVAGELVWRDNYLFVASSYSSHLFDIRRGLSSPLWSRGKPWTTVVDINNAGMIAYHDFNSNKTVLYDLFRYDKGIVRQWTNPATNMYQIILRDDRLYLLGFNDAVVYDYAKYLPNNT